MKRTRPSPIAPQSGLSLIELLISMTLGLIVLTAIGYIYTGSRQTYRQQDNIARIQENGRYALERMGQDLRMVGYLGCPSLTAITPVMTENLSPAIPAVTVDTVITGANNPDTLTLYVVNGAGMTLTDAMGADDDVPISASRYSHAEGSLFLISNCQRAEVFCASSAVASGATSIEHDQDQESGGGACNDSDNLGSGYGTNAMVFPFQSVTYRIANNPSGVPALFRGTGEEIVDNVEAMQITYGVDDGNAGGAANDGAVDRYIKASDVANWRQVLAVRVSLLLRSPDDNVSDQAQTYVWDTDDDGQLDDPVTAGDRRLRYIFTSTVTLRNRAL